MNILIVCLGNTCRSPMAGGLLRRMASERGLPLEVRPLVLHLTQTDVWQRGPSLSWRKLGSISLMSILNQ